MSTNATWHDILKFEGVGGDEIVNDVRVSCPEFTGTDLYGGAFDISKGQTTVQGDVYTGVRRIDGELPNIFKNANEGFGTSKGVYETSAYRLAMAGNVVRFDKALIEIDPDRGATMMKAEAARVLSDVIRKLGAQFFYGHGADATAAGAEDAGFQGIEAIVDSELTTSAGGTVAQSGTSTLTSAYLCKFSPYDGVSWIFGKGGSLNVSDIETVTEFTSSASTTLAQRWLMQTIELYPGVAVQSKYAIGRIANISTTTASTAGSISTSAFTDEHIMLALEKMRQRPDVIFMSRAAGILLGASRTNTISFKGASLKVAPISMPTSAYDVPILYTDSLLNTEAAVA